MTYPTYAYESCDVTIETTRAFNGKWRWSATIENRTTGNVEEVVLPIQYETEEEAFDDACMKAQHQIDYSLR
jgi:hypothetical protein